MKNELSRRRSLTHVGTGAIDSRSTTDQGPGPRVGSAIRGIAAGIAVASALLVAVASAGAAPAEAASPVVQGDGSRAAAADRGPRIVAVEGFAYRPKPGKALRVAALVLSRYPEVEAREFPKRYRKHLRFRAHAKLDVFDGKARIARSREAESLPVVAKRRSLRFVHLLTFSRAESEAILAADEPETTSARGLGSDATEESVETSALSALEVSARGQTLERSHAEEDALVGLSDQAPPRVVDGCVIVPKTECYHTDLSEEDLRGVDLSDAYLEKPDLVRTDLSGANLSGIWFREADLKLTNFTGADLRDAYFGTLFGETFDEGQWGRTNFTDADLRGAVFYGEKWQRPWAILYCRTTMPDGSINNRDC
jgi:hypothetical protein